MPTKNHVKISKEITGATNVYGIIGNPVKFSLSPLIQNTVSRYMGLDNVYVSFPVEDGQLEQAIKGAHSLGVRGLNITKPYKQDVMPLLTYIDPLALKIGAVNTLKYEQDGYVGYNTDADGLYTSLLQNNIDLTNQDIIVLGAGGAARAVCMMAANYQAKSIYIINRTLENAQLLANEVKKHYDIDVYILPTGRCEEVPDKAICFQTTSVGMGTSSDTTPIGDCEFFAKLSVAVDLIYNPFETLFLKKAKQSGAYTINGFGMLIYQAIKAYEIWNEIELSDKDLKVLITEIEAEYIRMNV